MERPNEKLAVKPFFKFSFSLIGGLFFILMMVEVVSRGFGSLQGPDLALIAVLSIWGICSAYFFRIAVLRFSYYGLAILFYGLGAFTVYSFLSYIRDEVYSFLSAPIGIKLETRLSDISELFIPAFISALVTGGLYYGAKSLRDEVKELPILPESLSKPDSPDLP